MHIGSTGAWEHVPATRLADREGRHPVTRSGTDAAIFVRRADLQRAQQTHG